ncbi:MAG: class I SAM-dependent methyltransferase [bacterium]|nr:class I SAM-dependent methyltransferase [bacterium]
MNPVRNRSSQETDGLKDNLDPSLVELYHAERELADRLRNASREERRGLYRTVYDELFARFSARPELHTATNPEIREQELRLQFTLLEPLATRETVFLEIGAGDCGLTLMLAGKVQKAIAVDASPTMVDPNSAPGNFECIRCDSPPYPLSPGQPTIAYSCHFIEHLHPEDAEEHAKEIYRLLAENGSYVCVTPNRLLGPHDISKHFDESATGLHLCEYGYRELTRLLRNAGFRRVMALTGVGVPARARHMWPLTAIEHLLALLSRDHRLKLISTLAPQSRAPFRPLEQVVVLAQK